MSSTETRTLEDVMEILKKVYLIIAFVPIMEYSEKGRRFSMWNT